ncbi:MAG: hypothetical protein KF816_06585 [Melioribacteraceae bacterium]|nr:hypothetical protein [Melioribacteraceae bacterium]
MSTLDQKRAAASITFNQKADRAQIQADKAKIKGNEKTANKYQAKADSSRNTAMTASKNIGKP